MTSKRQNDQPIDSTASKKQSIEFHERGNIKQYFGPNVFDEELTIKLEKEIANSEPYKWGTIKNLIDDTLLRNVRKEVEREIHFTKKETDIYKVHQSGDLANLSGLDWDDLSRLPSLFKLREALYSQDFRNFISRITKCGKLSGLKTDMSINTYTKGCHLLTHDDVIGTRRVSFILYLPDPDKLWKEHYGGALRLFPKIIPNVPYPDYNIKLIPQFNQIAFFTVQPGLSFHEVEEVRVDKQRLSIQGWYHIPQYGEDGFIEGERESTEAKSTLQQLESKELEEYDFPKEVRIPFSNYEIQNYEQSSIVLDDYDLKQLSKFLNPKILTLKEINRLKQKFIEENVIEIDGLLNDEFANNLRKTIRKTELDEIMPKHANEVQFPWKISLPPHKWRYLYLDGKQPEELSIDGVLYSNRGPQESPNFQLLQNQSNVNETSSKLIQLASFFKSISFKKWLSLLTDLIPISDQILVRRFRPGHDFTLATSINDQKGEIDAILEATLCLTPSQGWESGELGGYELVMATEDNEDEIDDPSIYRSSKEGDDDSVLVNSQASWNKLILMVRDPSVLKFIKYVSFNANGSRWDISGQWDIKQRDDDNDDENDIED
ncbi:hypothetical protein WICMUC_002069 [Wickerhamomyces mucosus]|uniref:uS12 prolyl 3,4-dihydroxylase n=1 Tax=Wickerhamomyces mucosus TaxID=1378264 RepID=A0A9P8PQA1_9ASCO|nr:hypothetical protein WICMUC_002069 [Wickerhamomyces mucosus]